MVHEQAPRTARERGRAELTAEIIATAKRHLADHGPAGLSLRAVARELGMASSALYRYFPSRDALLTRLIIDAYDALGDACDAALANVEPDDLLGRFQAVAHGSRRWALAHPHEYALIYGSPVPGYAAPTDTVDPASRVIRHLFEIGVSLDRSGASPVATADIPEVLETQLADLLDAEAPDADRQRMLAVVNAWAMLFGMISFEVFGRFNGMFDDANALFGHQVDRAGLALGMKL